MKIFFTSIFLIQFSISSILQSKQQNPTLPESKKKTQVQFDTQTGSFYVNSSNPVSAYAKDSKLFYEQKEAQEENKIPLTEEEKDFGNLLSQMTGGEEIQIDQSKLDCTDPKVNCSKDKRVSQAKENLLNIEKDLKSALNKSGDQQPVVISGDVLKTIIQYLKHIDYINALENGFKRNEVPQKPEAFVIKEYDMNEERMEKERRAKNEKRKKEIQKHIDEISKQIEEGKENQNESLVLELDEKKTKLLGFLEDLENDVFDDSQLSDLMEQKLNAVVHEEELESQKKPDEAELVRDEIKVLEDRIKLIEAEMQKNEEILLIDEKEEKLDEDKTKLIIEEQKGKTNNSQIINAIDKKEQELEKNKEQIKDQITQIEIGNGEQPKTEEKKEPETKKQTIAEEDKNIPEEFLNTEKYVEGKQIIKELGESGGELVYYKQDGSLNFFTKDEYEDDTFKDINLQLITINKIEYGYNKMFKLINYDPNQLPKDKQMELRQILLTYENFKKFIFYWNDNKLKLMRDLRYMGEKMRNVRDNVPALMKYYELEERFDDIMIRINVKEPDFIKKADELAEIKSTFEKDKKEYISNNDILYETNDLLYKETKFLADKIMKNDKIKKKLRLEAVIDILPKILKMRESIKERIASIKENLKNLEELKRLVEKYLMDLELIIDGKGELQLQKKNLLNGFVKKNWFWSLILILHVNLFQFNYNEKNLQLLSISFQILPGFFKEILIWLLC